jgi:lipoprotein NlpD
MDRTIRTFASSPFALRTLFLAALAGTLAACSTAPQRPGPSAPTGPGTTAPALAAQPPIFVRPASGATISRYDGNRNKGIDIAGNAGDPIIAAADGRVVYVGSELRGYGNMVIIQHSNNFLTAYAHNRAVLVREKQFVNQGQKIAEMGDSGADRVKLHFEVRKQGNAVDPEPYLQGKLR